jgi:hypothetical protein
MPNTTLPLEDLHAELERRLIEGFLEARGHSRQSVDRLPAAEATALLAAASAYASLRLAEIESRARYIVKIHRPS